MPRLFFIHSAPYVLKKPGQDGWYPGEFPIEPDTDKYRKKVFGYVFNWMLERGMITVQTDQRSTRQTFLPNLEEHSSGFNRTLYTFNPRVLQNEEITKKIIGSLNDNNVEYRYTDILNLCVTLPIVFNREYIDILITKIYTSLGALPTEGVSWEYLHQKYPFLWVIILINIVYTSSCQLVR